ncbi:hypothetical protein MesoLj113b_71900 (plasmid) [Mesorhizobium sp. 113-3-3]|nr:hypothetical protein MesoLj113b_71900 [Mesorhizobium sp. 113-3-3]
MRMHLFTDEPIPKPAADARAVGIKRTEIDADFDCLIVVNAMENFDAGAPP